ncbi:MAG: FkbM family methyltransferase [Pseudomonadota bacterium]
MSARILILFAMAPKGPRNVNRNSHDGNVSPIQVEEIAIIDKCINDGDVVFDVGAFHGDWSNSLSAVRDCSIHLFEASPEAYSVLSSSSTPSAALNHAVVSDHTGNAEFYAYRDKPRLSSIYRRRSVEAQVMPSGFDTFTVPSIRLDDYWSRDRGLINFLKIDVEGAEYDVLRGANDLLRQGVVDFFQFEYSGTFEDAGTSLKLVFYYLRRLGYCLYQVKGQEFSEIPEFHEQLEDFQYTNYLAVNERHRKRFKGETPRISIQFSELDNLATSANGVIHIGAHEGVEVEQYRRQRLDPIVLIEANPKHASNLEILYGHESDVRVVGKAISDHTGVADFNIASNDQSSSLLNLKTHAVLYPNIKYTDKIKVETTTLDQCIFSLFPNEEDQKKLNFLVMDIQGAELMALRGGRGVLANIDAIQTEVNFDELYQSCGQVWEIDQFLEEEGFVRFKTDTPFDRSWGDALYVRRPIVTNSTIGRLGRFGNQIFQYLFLRCHSQDMGFRFENTPWVGDEIFDIQPGVEKTQSGLREIRQVKFSTDECDILNSTDRLSNANLEGFFQYNTQIYKSHRSNIHKEFSFKNEFAERAELIKSVLDAQDGITVGIHLRRGDYGKRIFFIAPTEWYLEWLYSLKEIYSAITIYLASDEVESLASSFHEFRVLTARDFGPTSQPMPGFFDDFAALTLCDRLAISNSTFSFAAAMLNNCCKEFLRPDLASKGLIKFDPWSAEPLLRDEVAEDHGTEFLKR